MEFEYTGQDGNIALELIVYGIMEKGEVLKKGQRIEIPDENKRLVSALDASGLFQRTPTTRKTKKKKEEE